MEPDFETSKLGTKDYWDSAYSRELSNFEENGDVGEVWFGETTLETVVDFICEDLEGIVPDETTVLDLGCGNGYTLIELAKKGFKKLHGVDYSSQAIDLAINIAKKEELDITYAVMDILDTTQKFDKKYQLVVDKGTFDAISLSEDRTQNQQKYIESLKNLLSSEENSYFVITSCNFTRDEIKKAFSKGSIQLEYPTFQFGGVEGTKVCTVAFVPLDNK